MLRIILAVDLILAVTLNTVQNAHSVSFSNQNDGLELIILHNNDIHGRFDETGQNSITCTKKVNGIRQCYGGFARTAHVVRQFRERAKRRGGTPVLFLNAGDTYTGTTWFQIFKDRIAVTMMNALQPDAMCIGNHEFDEGVDGLLPFIRDAQFPILAANLNLSKVPEMKNIPQLQNSTIFTISGVKVGVIGYVTPETKFLNRRNDVEYIPEIEAVNLEAAKLEAIGVNIIIALGHSGFDADREVARNCPAVDLVVGGHTNTFLYTGTPPDSEKPQDLYPTIVEQSSGKKVPVVQAFAFTKYLGYLKIKFDRFGNLLHSEGNPILLDHTIPQDQDILDLLELFRPKVTVIENEALGTSHVILDADKHACRKDECNMGNMIADAMVYARVKDLVQTEYKYWTDAAIAFIQAGALRSSIERKPNSVLTKNDVLSVLPFGNGLYVAKVTGRIIRSTLEYSASTYDLQIGIQSNGGYLQMSGIQVVFNMTKPIGERVVNAKVRCAKCMVPEYHDIDDEKVYKIITTDFLLNGGDGHSMVDKNAPLRDAIEMGIADSDAVAQYIKDRHTVNPGVEGRIKIYCGNKCQ